MASTQLLDKPQKPHKALDPHKGAVYTIKLSDRITNPTGATSAYSSVKYNHKPPKAASTTITPTADNDENTYTLNLRDEDGTYKYSGQRSALKQTYVLLFDAAKHTATLEPLDVEYGFNVAATPGESDAGVLAKKYRQVRPRTQRSEAKAAGEAGQTDEDADDLFSDAGSETRSQKSSGLTASDDEEPEEGNPYDFRNFLHQAQGQVHANDAGSGFASPNSTASGTPMRAAAAGRATPLSQGLRKESALKPLPRVAARPAEKKVTKRQSPEPEERKEKAGLKAKATASGLKAAKATATESKSVTEKRKTKLSTSTAASSTAAGGPPSIRLDRKASLREPSSPTAPATVPATVPATAPSSRSSARSPTPSDEESSSDENGLLIDFGDSKPKPKRSMALAFPSAAGNGPISLRSAADSASPSSRLHTPNLAPTRRAAEPEEFEMGAHSSDDEDEEEEDDGDVDMVPTGSQRSHRGADYGDEEHVHGHRHGHGHGHEQEQSDDGYAEDDDDVEGEVDGDVEPMELGSPAAAAAATAHAPAPHHHRQHHDRHHQQHQRGEEGDDEEEDEEEEEEFDVDFEAEMQQALASAAEEEMRGVGGGVADAGGGAGAESEEEVSEEE